MKRYKILAVAAAIAIISVGAVGTLAAYLTANDDAVNEITIGQNITEVQETFPDPPDIPPEGGLYTKDITVKNDDSVPCYIRISIEFSNNDIGKAVGVGVVGANQWKYISEEENKKLGGYWYYMEPVAPGEKTRSLFNDIMFSEEMDPSLMPEDETFDVIVYEESVQ